MEIYKTGENINTAQSGQNEQYNEHKDILEDAKKFFGDKIEGLKNLKYEDIPAPVRDHIERHPRLTAVQLVLIVMTLAPGLIVGPVLGVLGFSSIGPVAGSAATAYQSANRATWLFSALQSAAMGGYAAAAVNSVASAATGIGVGVSEWFRRRQSGQSG